METPTKTKLMTPELPTGSLYSRRIKALDIASSHAVVVTAPAGYGKTTAVLLSLRKFRETTHWYRLEKEDSTLCVFFQNLIETLFRRWETASDSRRGLLSIRNILEEYPLLSAVVCQDASSCYGDGPVHYLVLDDYQNVAGDKAIDETVRYLISNMPPSVHIIILSRVDTAIRLEYPAQGRLLTIDGQNLLFTKEEIAELFASFGEAVSPAYVSEAYAYTEGWIAGLTLLQTPPSWDNRNRSLENDRQKVFKFIFDEALAGLDRTIVDSLARLSLLFDFTADDLSAILHMDNPAETIAWLEERNLYLQKTGEDEPVYRFHSMFRDALYSMLGQAFSADEIARTHQRAAAHYVQKKRYPEAVRHFVLADDAQSAMRLAAAEGQRYMDMGRTSEAVDLLHALPEPLIQRNATLMMILGASLTGSETDRSLACLEKAIEMAVKEKNTILALKTQGFMMSVCAQRNDFTRIKAVMTLIPKHRALLAGKQAGNMVMSLFMKFVVTDKIAMAKVFGKLVDRIDTPADLWDYFNCLSKGTLCYVSGDFRKAGEIISRLKDHPVALSDDRWRALGLGIASQLAALMRMTDHAHNLIDELARIGEKYAFGLALGNAAYYDGIVKYQNRDLAGAIQAMGRAEKIFADSRNHMMEVSSRVMKTAWRAEMEPREAYAAEAEANLAMLSILNSNHGQLDLAQTVAAAQHIKEGSLNKAEGLLKKACQAAKGRRAHQSVCGIAMHLAALYRRAGDSRREAAHLKLFAIAAQRNGYLYFREMSYPALVAVCARCMEKGLAAGHMANIVGAYFGPAAAQEMMRTPLEAAANPEAFIARHPREDNAAPKGVRVKLLGAFSLRVDEREIAAKTWKTRKISGILKYILANSRSAVSRDTLASAFWPDSDAKAAHSSLRVALSELRKALASFEMGFETRDALLAEDKNGFTVRHPERVVSDEREFLALYAQSREEESRENRFALFRRMLNLYDGDLFATDDIEDEWIIARREHCKSIFIEVSHKLIAHCLGREPDHAEELLQKHLLIDPLDERANRGLIEIYTASGRAREASALRGQFAKRCRDELGVRP